MTIHSASSLIKRAAHRSLNGNWSLVISANIAYLFLTVLLSLLASEAAPGTGWSYFAIANVFLFLVDLIIGYLDYGIYAIYLGLQYRQRPRTSDLLLGFRENQDTILRMQAFLSVVALLGTLPGTIAMQYYGATWRYHLAIVVPLQALSLIVTLYIDLNYALVWFLLLDYPELSWHEVLRKSRHLMKGNRRVMLYIGLTYAPFYLISIVTVGISALWVMAFQYAAIAAFYRGLVNARHRVTR